MSKPVPQLHCANRLMIRNQFPHAITWVILIPTFALGHVFQWEYIDSTDPSLGKRESTTLTPDGASANFDSTMGLFGRDLTKAYLPGAALARYRIRTTILDDAFLAGANMYDVSGSSLQARGADMSGTILQRARLDFSDLTGASLAFADLTQSDFSRAMLTGVNFTGAIVADAEFNSTTDWGFTNQQLYQTASYQQSELGAIELASNDLRGWDFTGQQMASAVFIGTQLDGAVFTDTIVTAADFSQSDLADTQLYATSNYKNRQLDDMQLNGMDMSGWNFSSQSLVLARITYSELHNTVFDGADLTNAFIGSDAFNVQRDVSFRTANLTNATFDTNGRWERADFTGANLEGARLRHNGFVDSKFRSPDMGR